MLKQDIFNINFCHNNRTDQRCECMLKTILFGNDEKSLLCNEDICGPNAILTTKMIQDKGKCQKIDCSIQIKNLNVGSNVVQLTNSCSDNVVSNLISPEQNTWGTLLKKIQPTLVHHNFFFSLIILALALICYYITDFPVKMSIGQ